MNLYIFKYLIHWNNILLHMSRRCNSNKRFNEINIQMLSKSLYDQVFDHTESSSSKNVNLEIIRKHLKLHGLHKKDTTKLEDVEFKLPFLKNISLEKHFYKIACELSKPYRDVAECLCFSDIPEPPKNWIKKSGWVMYRDGNWESIDYPLENGLIVDVEVAVAYGGIPIIATAVSSTNWYSWCSDYLIETKPIPKKLHLNDLISMESKQFDLKTKKDWPNRLFIGHNCSFDRSFFKEQYYISGPQSRFLDTMSLHIAISGLTSLQRTLFNAKKSDSKRKEVIEYEKNAKRQNKFLPTFEWMKTSSLNNLNDVYQLHCKGDPLKKEDRNIFVEGSLNQIRTLFQDLMTYCSQDVVATYKVFKVLWIEFNKRFPHPVTFSGMLEMGSAYLPINENWEKYMINSENTFNTLNNKVKDILINEANKTVKLQKEKYSNDPWLYDLDWSIKSVNETKLIPEFKEMLKEIEGKNSIEQTKIVMEFSKKLPKRVPHMPNYPKWYKDLCPKHYEVSESNPYGPSLISTLRRISPKLLKLTWDGFPLFYSSKYGWGYLVPKEEYLFDNFNLQIDEESNFPSLSTLNICKETLKLTKSTSTLDFDKKLNILLEKLESSEDPNEKAKLWKELQKHGFQPKKKISNKTNIGQGPYYHTGNGPYIDLDDDIPGFFFFKLPHKDGPDANCGNPLSKEYLIKFDEGVLKSYGDSNAEQAVIFSKMSSYWKMNRERILNQLYIELPFDTLPICAKNNFDKDSYIAAILPRVITAGTVTRRAVESTWLTASNAYKDRVGSELKAMVQCPKGYNFVGADVDSQELWIASLLGDSHFQKIHGCTALGWMTLQGNKADGTDMHSKTAKLVGISRDEAKIFNYGRIYGAGKVFAQRLMMQFNHRLSKEEAQKKAMVMFSATKGKRSRKKQLDENGNIEIVAEKWENGSESEMFNKLEDIAKAEHPKTPVLGCCITKSLEPERVTSDFMTSRINWVVQSSAVDYLHLMLVSMKWLLETYKIDGRFSISIHDEVRYLVTSDDRYRAALALQITNLLVRSIFSIKLGINDLPQSVAFFSNIDIDTCLRKEVHFNCETPSNPLGMKNGYNVEQGENLTIYDILLKTNMKLNKE